MPKPATSAPNRPVARGLRILLPRGPAVREADPRGRVEFMTARLLFGSPPATAECTVARHIALDFFEVPVQTVA